MPIWSIAYGRCEHPMPRYRICNVSGTFCEPWSYRTGLVQPFSGSTQASHQETSKLFLLQGCRCLPAKQYWKVSNGMIIVTYNAATSFLASRVPDHIANQRCGPAKDDCSLAI